MYISADIRRGLVSEAIQASWPGTPTHTQCVDIQ